MGVVVERGSARCPRCVAVAKYAFIEGELDVVRYEVHCHACGEVYSEVNSLAPPGPTERALAPLPPLPTSQNQRRASWLAPFGRAAERVRGRVRLGLPTGLLAAEPAASGDRGPNA
ncbi:hypothetical protein [Mycobacterium sp. URHB0044]|jgi:hypothetical protein|uniref:hypothetical protein n=1 Tax=Mycobacterium sp. URHB0044 TaxID=1380386 RepID=UPI00055CB6D1|nr:hypothetical protein [Mycobacterium sp. URHB0044]